MPVTGACQDPCADVWCRAVALIATRAAFEVLLLGFEALGWVHSTTSARARRLGASKEEMEAGQLQPEAGPQP